MTDITEKLQAFLGHDCEVKYLCRKNKKLETKQGVLMKVKLRGIEKAYFQNRDILSCIKPTIGVDLRRVVFPHINAHDGISRTSTTQEISGEIPKSICGFKQYDEVIVKSPTADTGENDGQCIGRIGRITLVGEMFIKRQFEIVALVEVVPNVKSTNGRSSQNQHKKLKEQTEILLVKILDLEKPSRYQEATECPSPMPSNTDPSKIKSQSQQQLDTIPKFQTIQGRTKSLVPQIPSNTLEPGQHIPRLEEPNTPELLETNSHDPANKILQNDSQTENSSANQLLNMSTPQLRENAKTVQNSESLESKDLSQHENIQRPLTTQDSEIGTKTLVDVQDKELLIQRLKLSEGHKDVVPQGEVTHFPEADVKINYKKETSTKIKRARSSSQTNVTEDIQDGANSDVSSIKRKLDWKHKIDVANFLTLIGKQTNSYPSYGIQGSNNSCYIDSSIFALFSFNHGLDTFISQGANRTDEGKFKKIMRNKIIKPLRTEYFVSSANMIKLRYELAEKVNTEYVNAYMDVEEFLLDFFNLIGTPELFEYDTGTGDHIHQIMLPLTWNSKSKRVPLMCVQKLLEESFESFEVKLAKRPDRPFIIKLPVSEGVLIPCEGVIPNLSLNLHKITLASEKSQLTMKLSAVICLRRSHFVAFVRTGQGDKSEWVFMDSNPVNSKPECHIMPHINECIENALECLENPGCKTLMEEPSIGQFRLFRDAYICVYV